MIVSRREVLRGGLSWSLGFALAACGRAEGERGVVRIGYMGNLTHAPAINGIASGRVASALSPLKIESRVLGAGPRVVEALLGNSIDIGVAGPAAVIAAHALHPGTLTIVSGVCSGGASLVLARGRTVETLANHATLATPQLGSTQDVSLRKFLHERGLVTADRGGDVHITQLAGALAKVELNRGTLTGAWMPEPWATRLCTEAPVFRAIDERDRWPGGSFATSIVVVRSEFLRTRRADVARFVAAMETEIARASPDESRDALSNATHAKWDARTWNEAWSRVTFTKDAMHEPIATFARDAYEIGALRTPANIETLFT